MSTRKFSTTVVILAMVTMLVSCASKTEQVTEVQKAELAKQIPCVVVLPVETELRGDASKNFDQAAELEKGAGYMDTVIAERLAGHQNVRTLSSRQLTALIPLDNDTREALISKVAEQLKCNVVLVTTLSHYQQRVGGEYGAERPAAVTFSMKLFDVGNRSVIWSSQFSEEQQSLLSNMMSLSSAVKRGLRWVTAEELAAQGIADMIQECPYL